MRKKEITACSQNKQRVLEDCESIQGDLKPKKV